MIIFLKKDAIERNNEWMVNGFVIFQDTKIVGFLFYNTSKINPTIYELAFLLIDNEYRRIGYGRKLLMHFLYKINEKPALIKVKIQTQEKAWYKKFGFREKDEMILFNDFFEGLNEEESGYKMLYYLTANFIQILQCMKNIRKMVGVEG